MAHDPARLLREGHAAFNDRDRDRLLEKIADDVTWHSPGDSPLAGTYNSREELWDRFFAPAWEAPLRVEDHEVIGTDEHAVALFDLVVSSGDGEKRWKSVEIGRVVNGKLVERWSFTDRQGELDQFLKQMA